MKRIALLVSSLILGGSLASAASVWQYGRIGDVKKSITTTTKAWVVNTPLNEEQTHYTISVHVQGKLIVGSYDVSTAQSDPPPEWAAGVPVKLEVIDDSLFLRSPTGSLRLHITQRKTAAAMQPLTVEETKKLTELEAAPESRESMVGFSKSGEKSGDSTATPEPAPQPGAPPPATGSITVRSTPFLSEVFVDGDSMGYTPAKIALGQGKHTFRVEKSGYKAWSKEMTITVGSELTLDATLERK